MLTNIIFTLILYTSCCKDDLCDPKPDPCDLINCNDTSQLMGKLDTLWTTKLISNENNPIHQRSIFYNDGSVYLTYSGSPIGMIASYDVKNNGASNWLYRKGNEGFISTFIIPEKNILINKTYGIRLSIDMNTGEEFEYVISPEYSSARGIVLGNYLYYDETEDNNRTVHLRRSHINNLQVVETLYTLDDSKVVNSKKSINSMNLWIHPDTGDSILIFQHRMLNRVDVVAWNMNKQEVMWKHDDLTKLGNSNHQQVLIYENKAYFGGGTAFYCFDMFSGEIIWQFDHPSGINSFMIYKPVIAIQENTIIVKDGAGVFRGFDLMTGMVRMTNQGSGHSTVSSGSPIYHKGIVYFTEKSLLYAIRASSGQLLWSERSSRIPMGYTNFQGELAIDEERGVIYATDSDELFAIRLYED